MAKKKKTVQIDARSRLEDDLYSSGGDIPPVLWRFLFIVFGIAMVIAILVILWLTSGINLTRGFGYG